MECQARERNYTSVRRSVEWGLLQRATLLTLERTSRCSRLGAEIKTFETASFASKSVERWKAGRALTRKNPREAPSRTSFSATLFGSLQ